MTFDFNARKCYRNAGVWHNVALPEALCRDATLFDIEQYPIKDGIWRPSYQLPNDEFMLFCGEAGIHVIIDQCFADMCSIYVPTKFAPMLKLRFDLSDRHI